MTKVTKMERFDMRNREKRRSDVCQEFGLVSSIIQTVWKNRTNVMIAFGKNGSIIKLWLSRLLFPSCRSLSRRYVAQGEPLGDGCTLHPFCVLCNLHEPMERNHLGQRAAWTNGTECERYLETRTKIMENWLYSLLITITTLMTAAYY
jgi:hypothetical protein